MDVDGPVGLLQLPKEIIGVILSHLDYWKWLLHCRSTCRQLLQCVQSQRKIPRSAFVISDFEQQQSIIKSFPNIETLFLDIDFDNLDSYKQKISRHIGGARMNLDQGNVDHAISLLKHQSLDNTRSIFFHVRSESFDKLCRELQSQAIAPPPMLSELRIFDSGDVHLPSAWQNQLKSIDIFHALETDDDEDPQDRKHNLSAATQLEVLGIHAHPEYGQVINVHTSLRQLNLWWDDHIESPNDADVDSAFLYEFLGPPNGPVMVSAIEKVVLSGLECLRIENMEEVVLDVSAFAWLTKLTELEVYGKSFQNVEELGKMTTLSALKVSLAFQEEDPEILTFLDVLHSLPNLEVLTLNLKAPLVVKLDPSRFASMNSLKQLAAIPWQLSESLPFVAQCPKLRHLELDLDQINHLSNSQNFLTQLTSLCSLRLYSHTALAPILSTILSAVSQIPYLQGLELDRKGSIAEAQEDMISAFSTGWKASAHQFKHINDVMLSMDGQKWIVAGGTLQIPPLESPCFYSTTKFVPS